MLRRHLPRRFGGTPIFVSPDAALRFWRPNLEQCDPELFRAVEEFVAPGDVVWDVGSNLGLFTFAAAARAGASGRVVSIEPDEWLIGLQRRTASVLSRHSAPVDILNVAVADEVGIAQFAVAARGRAANYLVRAGGSTQTGGVREYRNIVVVTLDWLAERMPPPRVLKVDVEGGEPLLLAGARRLFTEARPVLLCEVTPEHANAVAQLLREYRYVVLDAAVPAQERRALDVAVWSTLALPIERTESGSG